MNVEELIRVYPVERIRAEVATMGLGLDEGSSMFDTAVLLVSAVFLGQKVKDLATYTGFTEKFITLRAEKFRRAGIWRNGVTVADWLDESKGHDALMLDIMVGEGWVTRS